MPDTSDIALDQLRARLDRIDLLGDMLHAQHRCAAGGPFHILLDDGNIRDSDLLFCYQALQEPEWEHVRAIGTALFHELAMLSAAQRLCWHEAEQPEAILKVAGKGVVGTGEGYRVDE